MKIIVAVLMAASLMACGGKAKKATTPDNKTGTTDATKTDGMGGTTYGGGGAATPASAPAPDSSGGQ